jgi:hypothetical protein
MSATARILRRMRRNRPRMGAILLFLVAFFTYAGVGPARADEKRPTKKPAQPKRILPIAAIGKVEDADQVLKINERLAKKWKANKLTPSLRSTDYEFIRRASLDIIGRIAKPEEITRFLRDSDGTRRAMLVERLLGSEEYAKNWASIWTVWLMTRTGANTPSQGVYHEQLHKWLEEQFAKSGASYKDIVTELLTATGKTTENGAVNFILAHLGEPTPPGKEVEEGKFNVVPLTSRTTRLFLGLQTQCAQCHQHPFNKDWKQQHFWGVNAFFRQVDAPKGRPKNERMERAPELELWDNPSFNSEGIVFFEQRNGVVLPTKAVFLDGSKPTDGNRRSELAKFVTESPYFAKAYVNRMWAHFFARGFTNPVDDFGPENEPSHPELLDELTSQFKHYGYDPRRLIRWICNSDAYNLSGVANKTNDNAETEPYFSRMLLKALSPEQLFESLIVATQAEMFESKENRKKIRDDWMRNLTTSFGDDEGNEVTFNGTVVQALLMMNGGDIDSAVSSLKKGTVPLAIVTKGTPRRVMHQLYLAALNRPPTDREAERITHIFRSAPTKKLDEVAVWQDLFWALLNSNEFILNH